MKTKGIAVLSGIALVVSLVACRKAQNYFPPTIPVEVDNNSYVQFSVPAVQLNNNQLYALISIQTKNGQAVVSNKKITLDYIQGIYKTDRVKKTYRYR